MTRLDEETLNAYADGALDAEACARVESHLETDAAARELLQKLQRANALAAKAFDAPMHEPVPQALVDTILRRGDSEPTIRLASPRSSSVRAFVMPLAAALLLAVGLGTGLFLGRHAAQTHDQLALGPVQIESPLHRLLESHPTGGVLDIAGSGGHARRLSIAGTFRDRNGRACREVEVMPAGPDQQPLAAGVACRRADASWIIEGAARLAQAPSATGQDFEPSGVSEKDALDGLLGMLGAQTALSPDEEKVIMQRGWK